MGSSSGGMTGRVLHEGAEVGTPYFRAHPAADRKCTPPNVQYPSVGSRLLLACSQNEGARMSSQRLGLTLRPPAGFPGT